MNIKEVSILKPGLVVEYTHTVDHLYWSPGESIPDKAIPLPLKLPENPQGDFRIITRWPLEKKQTGMLVGWTVRQAGRVIPKSVSYSSWEMGEAADNPAYLKVLATYKVWVIAPVGVAYRFRKLVYVSPEDINIKGVQE